MAPASLTSFLFRWLALVVAGANHFLWQTELAAQTVPTIAVWDGGGGEWTDPHRWMIDGQPPATNNIIPGTIARPFWKVVIDGEDVESNVFLNGGPVIPSINELEITAGDTLQIFTPLALRTDVGGGKLSNSGNLFVIGNGVFMVSGSDMSAPGGILTLSGGGNVILDGEPVSLAIPGARVSGGGPVPRVLINEDNVISGTGALGEGSLVLVNRRLITADQAGKRLVVDPGGGGQFFPGDLTNDVGGVLSASNGGILQLSGGAFRNVATARIDANDNSFVDLDMAAHVFGGVLVSVGTGRFRVTGNAALTDVILSGQIDVQNGQNLTLADSINNAGNIVLAASNANTSLRIDGDVTLLGNGTVSLQTDSPNLSLAGIIGRQPGATLTIGDGQRIAGVGTVGNFTLNIVNQGTISADQDQRVLEVNAPFGSDSVNMGILEARDGGLLRLRGNLNLTGNGGQVQAHFDASSGASSVVLLDGVHVSGQRLQTPGNPRTAIGGVAPDPSKGVIRTQGNATTLDLRSSPPVNEGLLEIPGSSALTLQSKVAGANEMPPSLSNSGAIFLNAAEFGNSFLNVSGGDVRLTGGGRVVLSNSSRNNITQSVQEPRAHTLINVDNTIEGSGNIGGNLLSFVNDSGGTILAAADGELVIDPPMDTDAINRGLISTGRGGRLTLRTGKYTNDAGGLIRSFQSGTLRIEGGTLVNRGTVEANGSDGAATTAVVQGTSVSNTGILAATGGSRMQIVGAPILNASGNAEGTITAGDGSVVALGGGTVISRGRLVTSANGATHVVDRAGIVLPLTNDGVLQIRPGAELIVLGSSHIRGEPLTNRGTISLQSDERLSSLVHSRLTLRGFVDLTGQGRVILHDEPDTTTGIPTISSAQGILRNVDNTIQGAGVIDVTVLNQPAGQIIADRSHGLIINGILYNSGSVRAEGSGGIVLDQVVQMKDGSVQVRPSSSVDMNKFQNLGSVAIEAGAVFNAGEFDNGDPSDASEAKILIDGEFNGRLNNRRGMVSGSGKLNGRLVMLGKFKPGKSPGTFNVQGEYEQLPGGELEMELAGIDAGSQYDQLIVDGTATLDGIMAVRHLDGFIPATGTQFDVVSATTLIDNGFSLALLDGGLMRPAIVDSGNGTTVLRLTSIEGDRYTPLSGLWDNVTNWTDGAPPAAEDTAFIPGGSSADTTVAGPTADTTVFSLVVGSGDEAATSATTLELTTGIITTTRGTTLRRDGTLTGVGSLGGALYNAGTVAPDGTGGTITVSGDYTQAESGSLRIELGGALAGDPFDQLLVEGTAAIDGTLDVVLADVGGKVFEPEHGDVFAILTAGEVLGSFATVNFPTLKAERFWSLDYQNTTVLLAVVTAKERGDFDQSDALDVADIDMLSTEVLSGVYSPAFDLNGDMLVDGADRGFWIEQLAKSFFGDANLDRSVNFTDFLALSDGFGKTGGWSDGDFDGNGNVDFPDFLLLSENFGKTIDATVSVPEPGTTILLLIGLAQVFCRRRTSRVHDCSSRLTQSSS